jgi:dTDP-4-dehydrorhamnose reductase
LIESKHKPIVWITGAGGLIGNYLRQTAAPGALSQPVIALTRGQLDLLDFAAVAQRFKSGKPSVIIHCAAMSKPPACQAQPELARQVNIEITRRLVELAGDATFVFFSTDLVFDGRRGSYAETDAPNPLSVYAETKVAAEEIVAQHPRHLIIRTSLNGGRSPTGDRAFNEELVNAWRAGKTVSLFEDEFRSPMAAGVTARAIWELIFRGATGIYHVAGAERLSRLQIGELLAARWASLKPRINRTSLQTYSGPPRAPDTSLNCSKAQKLLSFALPGLTDWLAANPNEPF